MSMVFKQEYVSQIVKSNNVVGVGMMELMRMFLVCCHSFES